MGNKPASIEAVIPGARGRILGALLRLDDARTVSDLARLAHVSRDRAATVVDELARLGLVERRAAGRAWLVSIVDENPVTEALRQIEHAHDTAVAKLRTAAGTIDPRPQWMVAYGSWARGESTVDSDLDVAVIAPAQNGGDRDRFLAELDRWSAYAHRVTGLVPSIVIADDHNEATGRLWKSIGRDAVVLVDELGATGDGGRGR